MPAFALDLDTSAAVGINVSAARPPAAAETLPDEYARLIAERRLSAGRASRGIAARLAGSPPATARRPAPRPVRQQPHVARPAAVSVRIRVPAAGAAGRVVAYALAQIGKPYVWGAAGPRGFDCSGLALAAYAKVGVRLPHNADEMRGYGRRVPRSQLAAGDLVFWDGHVAISLGGNRIIHAPQTGDHVRIAHIFGDPVAFRRIT